MPTKRNVPFFPWLLLIVLLVPIGCDSGTPEDDPALTPRIIAPGHGSIDNPNALFLEWMAPGIAEAFDIEVATDPQFGDLFLRVDHNLSSALTVSALEIGEQYYWHVRSIVDDEVGDWSPTWTFTSASEAFLPPIPFLSFPETEATGLPTTVMVGWEPAPGALNYELHVSMEPGLERRVAEMTVNETRQSVRGLVNGYTYYWRVRSNNGLGSSNWSLVRKFVCVL